MRKSILAIDIGTYTGWAIALADKTIISGTQSFKPSRMEGCGMKYLKFKRWLTEINQSVGGIGEVHFERVEKHAGTIAAQTYGAFAGHLMSWCEENSIPYSNVPVGTIKKSATGKGNASKEQMINAAKKIGFNPVDDNEADAIHILRYVMETF